ncbi:hypothetical protein F3N43_10590 [Alkalilimnicola sp. S0819]|nr:hypothetical protein F3N43_10590 [Alkalilimnicola sp. S0819]MPQ17082.1 hypothetical protein [Alkalilimnicola sp. S0819]
MDALGAFGSGLQGLHRADEAMRRNADTVAKVTARVDRTENLNTALVESQSALHQAQASVKVVKAADEMLGTLLDTRA